MIYCELVGKGVVPSGGIARMKRKLIAILSTIVVGIMLGYLFLLSLLLGFLASKYAAGKSAGERGKVRSIIIPFRRWNIHLHHWLYAACLLVCFYANGIYLLTPVITYGFLSGFVFQGIYCYCDWQKVVVSRCSTTSNAGESFSINPDSQIGFAISEDNSAYKECLPIEGSKKNSDIRHISTANWFPS